MEEFYIFLTTNGLDVNRLGRGIEMKWGESGELGVRLAEWGEGFRIIVNDVQGRTGNNSLEEIGKCQKMSMFIREGDGNEYGYRKMIKYRTELPLVFTKIGKVVQEFIEGTEALEKREYDPHIGIWDYITNNGFPQENLAFEMNSSLYTRLFSKEPPVLTIYCYVMIQIKQATYEIAIYGSDRLSLGFKPVVDDEFTWIEESFSAEDNFIKGFEGLVDQYLQGYRKVNNQDSRSDLLSSQHSSQHFIQSS